MADPMIDVRNTQRIHGSKKSMVNIMFFFFSLENNTIPNENIIMEMKFIALAVPYQNTPGKIKDSTKGIKATIMDITPIILAHRLDLRKTSASLTAVEAKRHSRRGYKYFKVVLTPYIGYLE